jgi:hypothetical protein
MKPQGLKPPISGTLNGTAESVTLQNISAQGKYQKIPECARDLYGLDGAAQEK